MTSQMLGPLIGRHIIIWSRGGETQARDEGKLIAFDDIWVVIESTTLSTEYLYFPIANIRLLKPK